MEYNLSENKQRTVKLWTKVINISENKAWSFIWTLQLIMKCKIY